MFDLSKKDGSDEIKFVPARRTLLKITELCRARAIAIHGYIRRNVKFINGTEISILIPRIRVSFSQTKRIRTHILLPDFLLPYTRYNLKEIAIVNSDHIPSDTLMSMLSKSQWDKDINSTYENPVYEKYVTSRITNYIKRFTDFFVSIRLFTTKAVQMFESCFYPISDFYFFITKDNALSPINYLSINRHTVYKSASP